MCGNEFANQHVGFIDLNVKDPLVIEALPLEHFAVMDSDGQKNRIHNLPENELNDLVLEGVGHENHNSNPSNHVHAVGHEVVTQEHISHHEYKRDCQLDLQLGLAGDCPLAEVLGLVWEEDAQDSHSVDEEHSGPEVDALQSRVVELVNEGELESKDGEHQVKLDRGFKFSVLKYVSENNYFVKQD